MYSYAAWSCMALRRFAAACAAVFRARYSSRGESRKNAPLWRFFSVVAAGDIERRRCARITLAVGTVGRARATPAESDLPGAHRAGVADPGVDCARQLSADPGAV